MNGSRPVSSYQNSKNNTAAEMNKASHISLGSN
jgi:hypothetical protein